LSERFGAERSAGMGAMQAAMHTATTANLSDLMASSGQKVEAVLRSINRPARRNKSPLAKRRPAEIAISLFLAIITAQFVVPYGACRIPTR